MLPFELLIIDFSKKEEEEAKIPLLDR